jgi:hypothetical protein
LNDQKDEIEKSRRAEVFNEAHLQIRCEN